jgi:hypothetical protein
MKQLSPAAAAIWEAFDEVAERVGVFEDYGDALGAALRAAAEHLTSEEEPLVLALADRMRLDARNQFYAKLIAIAAELEGANPDCGEEASLHERFMEARHD